MPSPVPRKPMTSLAGRVQAGDRAVRKRLFCEPLLRLVAVLGASHLTYAEPLQRHAVIQLGRQRRGQPGQGDPPQGLPHRAIRDRDGGRVGHPPGRWQHSVRERIQAGAPETEVIWRRGASCPSSLDVNPSQ